MDADVAWEKGDFEAYNLENPADRLGFIRKVYGILTFQLFITSIFVLIGVVSEGYRDFVEDHIWLFISAIILSVIVLLVLFFVKDLHKKVPINYILLTIFTILEAYTLSAITAFYSPGTILIAVGGTFGLTTALTVYAIYCKSDFTTLGAYLIAVSIALLVFLLVLIILGSDNIYRLVFCPIAICLYGVYLIYDTQLIVGKKTHKIGYDDYILGSIALYIDIVGMFTYILSMFKN